MSHGWLKHCNLSPNSAAAQSRHAASGSDYQSADKLCDDL